MPDDGRASEPLRIRRSPTGRIPQWVLDEALGRPVDAPAWRAPDVPVQGARTKRPRKTLVTLLCLAVLGAVMVAVRQWRYQAVESPGGGIAAVAVPVAPVATPQVAANTGVAVAPGAPMDTPGPTTFSLHNDPPPGYGEQPHRLEAAAPIPVAHGHDAFTFMATLTATGAPVTWSPCRAIHFVVRAAHRPAGGQRMLSQAIKMTSRATGLRFVNDGTTSEPPSSRRQSYQPARYGKRWAPVLVAWATPREVPQFAGMVAGEAGPVRVANSLGDVAYVSGSVYLDPTKFERALDTEGPGVARALILHELGHLVGLAHVTDRRSIMYPELTGRVSRYSVGDRIGLADLGRGSCEPRL